METRSPGQLASARAVPPAGGDAATVRRWNRPRQLVAVLHRCRSLAYTVVSVVLGLAVWQLLSAFVVDPFFLPAPRTVATAFWDLTKAGTLPRYTEVSLKRIFAGWLIGSAVAIPIGLAVGAFRFARALVDPYLHFFRFIPAIALVSLFMAWFGIGELAKVLLIVYATSFIVAVNTATGVASIPDDKLNAARCLGAGPIRMFFSVTLPAAVPSIFVGMRLAMASSYLVIVAAEMVAANSGLGYLIWNSRLFFRVDWMFAGILTIGILGFLTDRAWRWFGRIVLRRFLREASRY